MNCQWKTPEWQIIPLEHGLLPLVREKLTHLELKFEHIIRMALQRPIESNKLF